MIAQGGSAAAVDAAVGRRVQARRLVLDIGPSEVAARIGVSPDRLRRFESGEDRIPARLLLTLAEALGVAVPYFFGAEGPAAETPPPRQRREEAELLDRFKRITDDRGRRLLIALAEQMAEPLADRRPA